MRQSNGYIIGFSAILTVILGGLLATAAIFLSAPQKVQVELDKKKQILGAVMNIPKGVDVIEFYDQNIASVVVDAQGNEVADMAAEDINVRKEYKKTSTADKKLPIYKFKSQVHEGQVEAYILPVYGNGLWDEVWGYVALSADFNTVQGVVFDHKAETPGLGARITDKEVQNRFKGRQITDKDGNLSPVKFLKGEGNPIADTDYQSVDGLSGASMTTNGVNAMLENYLSLYMPFIEKEKANLAKESVASGSGSGDIMNMKSSDKFIDHGVIGE